MRIECFAVVSSHRAKLVEDASFAVFPGKCGVDAG
jgi:hypothetical protein